MVLFGRFCLVCLVWCVWFGMFGLGGLVLEVYFANSAHLAYSAYSGSDKNAWISCGQADSKRGGGTAPSALTMIY